MPGSIGGPGAIRKRFANADHARPARGILFGVTRVYQEFVDFIAHGTTADGAIAFRPSDEARARVADLVSKEKAGELAPDERAELDHFLHVEHVMRLAKAKARRLARP